MKKWFREDEETKEGRERVWRQKGDILKFWKHKRWEEQKEKEGRHRGVSIKDNINSINVRLVFMVQIGLEIISF